MWFRTAVTALNDQVGITAADNVTLTGTSDAAVATIAAGAAITAPVW